MRKHMKRVCHCTLPGCIMMLATTMMLMAAPALMPVQAAVEQAESQVTGLVTDPDKQPLVGVTVTVVGTSTRTITDADGMFRIKAPAKSTTELPLGRHCRNRSTD